VRQIVAFFVDNVILLIYHMPTLNSAENILTSLNKDNEKERPGSYWNNNNNNGNIIKTAL